MRVAIVIPKDQVRRRHPGFARHICSGAVCSCGVVMLSKTPGPPTKDNMRQSRLASAVCPVSADRAVGSQATPSITPPQKTTLSDVMATLQSMNGSMNSKLDNVK